MENWKLLFHLFVSVCWLNNPFRKFDISFAILGTHWIRVSNNESQNFALLPIFAFDDDYVPLSPVLSPSIDHKSNNDKETNNSEKDFLNLSDISENLTSQPSTLSSPSAQKINRQIDQRQSPEVHVLDITDLSDPGVRIVSKFSFKDLNDIFQIKIYGKLEWDWKTFLFFFVRCGKEYD